MEGIEQRSKQSESHPRDLAPWPLFPPGNHGWATDLEEVATG